VRSTSELGA